MALTKVAWAPVTTQGSEAEPNAKTASTQWPEEPGQGTCLSGGWVSNPNSEGHKENFQLLPASTDTSPIFLEQLYFTRGPLYRKDMRLSCWGQAVLSTEPWESSTCP